MHEGLPSTDVGVATARRGGRPTGPVVTLYPVSFDSYLKVDSPVRVQRVEFHEEPWHQCWAQHSDCYDPSQCNSTCGNRGDFSQTLGLCPEHYEEIVPKARLG